MSGKKSLRGSIRELQELWSRTTSLPAPAYTGQATAFPDKPVLPPPTSLQTPWEMGPNMTNWDPKTKLRVAADRLAKAAMMLAADIGKTQISPELNVDQVLLQRSAGFLASLEEMMRIAGHLEYTKPLSDLSQQCSMHAADPESHGGSY